jgi:CRP/FNR family transcriptional regulator, cyclic AMP receptor protein
MIEVTTAALAAHPVLQGMSAGHLEVLAGSASGVAFPAGHRLFEEGSGANQFWLLQSGSVALDLHVPGQGRIRIDTLGPGELLGWSWRFAPYRWAFGAVTASPVEAFEFDAPAVRARCVAEPELGHEVTERLANVLAKRLESTRVRLIDASVRPVGTR